jgi:peroxiredoxin Q/BCP
MAQLRQDYEKFVKLDTEIIVAGLEKAEAFRDYWEKENLPFIGLPDPEHLVLKLYGQEVKIFKLGRMPAQVMIDKSGKVRFVHYGHSMSDIPPNEKLLIFSKRSSHNGSLLTLTYLSFALIIFNSIKKFIIKSLFRKRRNLTIKSMQTAYPCRPTTK